MYVPSIVTPVRAESLEKEVGTGGNSRKVSTIKLERIGSCCKAATFEIDEIVLSSFLICCWYLGKRPR